MLDTRRRWSLTIALIAVLALVGAACGEGDPPADQPEVTGGEFSYYIGEPESLIPANTNESEGGQVLSSMFTGLINYDPETSQPVFDGVAASVESEDNVTWTITLNEGWTFHNDEPVDAASFVNAWNFAAYGPNANGNSYFFGNVVGYDDLQCPTDDEGNCVSDPTAEEMSGLSVVDDLTIEVTLTGPFSQYPLTVGYTAFFPMPQAGLDDTEAFNEAPIGNGPFQIDGTWEHDQQIRLTKYADWAGGEAAADAVEYRIYSELDTAYIDTQAGNLDVLSGVPPAQIEAAKAEFGERFIERESSNFTYIGFPLYDERFGDKRLRQAFSMAINREEITEAIFFGTRTPALSLVSPVVAGSRPDPCEYCVFDPERAKTLFDEAGGWEGPLTLWFNSGAGHEDWTEAVANQWKANLGIETIEFESLEFAEYLGLLDAQEVTGPFRLGWIMDYPSPENYLKPLHSCQGSSTNTTYCNEEVDDLIRQGDEAGTLEDGITFYQQAEDLILEDMSVIPMFFGLEQVVHTENVRNVGVDAFGRTAVEDIEVVNP